MNEARKTRKIRGEQFAARYLSGTVIDIGAGDDLVCPHAERFDIEDGDANIISRFRSREAYDAVHSSHCLEHMRDPWAALLEWWSLLKPGGVFIIVVPHEDLYEQGHWPSRFNPDHKATFRLDQSGSWSPVSFDIRELIGELPHCEILESAVQDHGYDHSLRMKHGAKCRSKPTVMAFLEKQLGQLPGIGIPLQRYIERVGFALGIPVDQTLRDAVAQIQVVARKRSA